MEMSNYKKVLEELYSTIEAKNHDYGDSFEGIFKEFGVTYVTVRLSEKVDRLKTIVKGDKAMVDESLEDTLRDIAGYSTLALACLGDCKFANNYVGKHVKDPIRGAIVGYYKYMVTRLPAAIAFDLNNIVNKEIDAGGFIIDVTTTNFPFSDENDKEICISFTTDKDYPKPMFSIVLDYYWNHQSGKYRYLIKRRTTNGDNVLVEGGPYQC